MNDDSQFSVRGFSKGDLAAIEKLWEERYDQEYIEKRRVLFEWLTEKNPFRNERFPYFLLRDGERVIGMHGHMPLVFHVKGHQKSGYLAHDDLLSGDYRGKGLGRIMLKGVAEQAPLFAGAPWHNEPNYRLYLKSGWLSVPNFYPYLRIFDWKPFIERKVRNKNLVALISSAVNALHKIRQLVCRYRSPEGVVIEEIEQFGEAFDSFFHEVAGFFEIIVSRDRKYLNWKYVQKPFNNYKRYAARDENGTLSGYAVVKTATADGEKRGKILDILVHPEKENVFLSLIEACLNEFREAEVAYVEIILTYPAFRRLLRRAGFLRAPTPQKFMVSNWEDDFDQEFVENITNWYLTYSDSDGDAWTVDF